MSWTHTYAHVRTMRSERAEPSAFRALTRGHSRSSFRQDPGPPARLRPNLVPPCRLTEMQHSDFLGFLSCRSPKSLCQSPNYPSHTDVDQTTEHHAFPSRKGVGRQHLRLRRILSQAVCVSADCATALHAGPLKVRWCIPGQLSRTTLKGREYVPCWHARC